jgi:hypothetical protein
MPAYLNIRQHSSAYIPAMPTYVNNGRDTAYMPAWPILLCSGQAQPWSTNTKATTFFISFWSLDPIGGHPPDTSPRSCHGPPVLTEGPWQVQHTISFLLSQLLLYAGG